ncbi:hypothetical protein NL676_005101 [Syzygium grande]|nr:hypothetical protein NL676_005101 [Syzygium grande]
MGEGTHQSEGIDHGIDEGACANVGLGNEIVVEHNDLNNDDLVHKSDYIVDDDKTNFFINVTFLTDANDHDNEKLLDARKNMTEFYGRATKNLIIEEPSTELVPS